MDEKVKPDSDDVLAMVAYIGLAVNTADTEAVVWLGGVAARIFKAWVSTLDLGDD